MSQQFLSRDVLIRTLARIDELPDQSLTHLAATHRDALNVAALLAGQLWGALQRHSSAGTRALLFASARFNQARLQQSPWVQHDWIDNGHAKQVYEAVANLAAITASYLREDLDGAAGGSVSE